MQDSKLALGIKIPCPHGVQFGSETCEHTAYEVSKILLKREAVSLEFLAENSGFSLEESAGYFKIGKEHGLMEELDDLIYPTILGYWFQQYSSN